MKVDPARIVMAETRCGCCGIPIVQVYHRDFAIMRAEARSAEEAAGYLVNRLAAAIGDAVDPTLREAVRAAHADARAFHEGCAFWSQPTREWRSALAGARAFLAGELTRILGSPPDSEGPGSAERSLGDIRPLIQPSESGV